MLFNVNTLTTSLHLSIWLLPKLNLSDNMPNWFNFDPYCVVASKWVPNLIQQAFYKFPKSVFSMHSLNQMKNQPKVDISLQPPRFTIYSLIVFPFEKFLTDNLKTYLSINADLSIYNLSICNHVPKYKHKFSSY